MSFRSVSAIAVLLPVLALGACEHANDPISACNARVMSDGIVEPVIQTDKSVYSLSTDTHAGTSLTNEGPKPLYLSYDFASVERLENGKWTSIGPWIAADGVCPTFAVQPGATTSVPEMRFAYVGNQPGTYRFLYNVTRDPAGKHLLEESRRASPPFELRQ